MLNTQELLQNTTYPPLSCVQSENGLCRFSHPLSLFVFLLSRGSDDRIVIGVVQQSYSPVADQERNLERIVHRVHEILRIDNQLKVRYRFASLLVDFQNLVEDQIQLLGAFFLLLELVHGVWFFGLPVVGSLPLSALFGFLLDYHGFVFECTVQ